MTEPQTYFRVMILSNFNGFPFTTEINHLPLIDKQNLISRVRAKDSSLQEYSDPISEEIFYIYPQYIISLAFSKPPEKQIQHQPPAYSPLRSAPPGEY